MTTLSQNEVGTIRKLILKHPRQAFISDTAIARQWKALNYPAPPDFDLAVREYDSFMELIETSGTELEFLPEDSATGLDSIYVRDAAVVSSKGLVLCSMGKRTRRGEPGALGKESRRLGMPILGEIQAPGFVEGGDVVWLDETTLLVGRGYRTNDDGIAQLKALLADCLEDFIVVPLPHWRGEDDVFHLMSILSPLDRDLALVYSPLLPVPFREELQNRGIRLIEVPDEEFAGMGCNVLALKPRVCVMLEGNPVTRRRLCDSGVEVLEYGGNEISRKGAGGPTCLTRPLVRDALAESG